jgi:hypothetical protein
MVPIVLQNSEVKNGLHVHGGPSEGKMQYIVSHRDNLLGTYL